MFSSRGESCFSERNDYNNDPNDAFSVWEVWWGSYLRSGLLLWDNKPNFVMSVFFMAVFLARNIMYPTRAEFLKAFRLFRFFDSDKLKCFSLFHRSSV